MARHTRRFKAASSEGENAKEMLRRASITFQICTEILKQALEILKQALETQHIAIKNLQASWSGTTTESVTRMQLLIVDTSVYMTWSAR